MKRKGLLTETEVVELTPVKLDFNPCSMREAYRIERTEAIRCIGMELWESMIESLADYSKVESYEGGTTYAERALVSYGGRYYVAEQETALQPPTIDHWGLAPKFNRELEGAEDYEDLWCNFMAPYLAFVVLSERYPYIVIQLGDQGMVYGGRKYNTQDENFLRKLETAIFRDREKSWQLLDEFMRGEASKAKTAYEGWKGYVDNDLETCSCNKDSCNECRDRRPRHVGRYRFGKRRNN